VCVVATRLGVIDPPTTVAGLDAAISVFEEIDDDAGHLGRDPVESSLGPGTGVRAGPRGWR